MITITVGLPDKGRENKELFKNHYYENQLCAQGFVKGWRIAEGRNFEFKIIISIMIKRTNLWNGIPSSKNSTKIETKIIDIIFILKKLATAPLASRS